MIPSGVEVFVALAAVDMRSSFDRLAGIAKEQVGYEGRSGALFVFYGRRRDALKFSSSTAAGCVFFTSVSTVAFSPCRHPCLRERSTWRSTIRRFKPCSTG